MSLKLVVVALWAVFLFTDGLTKVSGMIFIKKPVMVDSCALAAYSSTLVLCKLLGSIFKP